MEFNMNLMFLNNSNYNADSLHVCFIKQVYGSVFLFYSHNYGKLHLTGIASRISVYIVVILSTYLRSSFLFVFSATDLKDVPQYVMRMASRVYLMHIFV